MESEMWISKKKLLIVVVDFVVCSEFFLYCSKFHGFTIMLVIYFSLNSFVVFTLIRSSNELMSMFSYVALIPSSIHQSRILPILKSLFFLLFEHSSRTTNEWGKTVFGTYPGKAVEKLFFDNNDVEIESPMYQANKHVKRVTNWH